MEFSIDNTSHQTLKNSFDQIARDIMLNHALMVNDKEFRLTEIEFYYYDQKHQDPFVHRDDLQLDSNQWYFHGSGLDLTFGKREKSIYASFLIRGIRCENEFISGPLKILYEVFKAFRNDFLKSNSIFLKPKKKQEVNELEPISAPRIGLNQSRETNDNFFEKPYRYITDLVPGHKFKNKEALVRKLFEDNKIAMKDVKNILGYLIDSKVTKLQ